MKQIQPIRVFEAFAGYGGASFGLKRCGYPYKVIGLSEIDPSASRILDVNFPDIKNYGNIVTVRERLEKNKNYIPDFDLFTGGFPSGTKVILKRGQVATPDWYCWRISSQISSICSSFSAITEYKSS